MVPNCDPVYVDLFLHVYEADFHQGLFKNKNRKLDQTFNSSFRYIDDDLSLNNSRFGEYLHRIRPNELKGKDITDTQQSTSYLDIHIAIENGGRLKTNLYDKRDDFTFPIVIYPFINGNVQASTAYEVYISQIIRYSRHCVQYSDFLDGTKLLTQ